MVAGFGIAEDPQPLKRGHEWLSVRPSLGTPGRRRTQHYALKDAKHAIRHLKIPLVAGEMECNQDVIRKPPPPVLRASLRSISGGAAYLLGRGLTPDPCHLTGAAGPRLHRPQLEYIPSLPSALAVRHDRGRQPSGSPSDWLSVLDLGSEQTPQITPLAPTFPRHR